MLSGPRRRLWRAWFFFVSGAPAGIVKGLFSNEAGCGTATMSHVSSKETVPARQGLFGIFEVFCDTILMCTLTAFVILLTLGDDLAGIGGGGVFDLRPRL